MVPLDFQLLVDGFACNGNVFGVEDDKISLLANLDYKNIIKQGLTVHRSGVLDKKKRRETNRQKID